MNKKEYVKKSIIIVIKLVLTAAVLYASWILGFAVFLIGSVHKIAEPLLVIGVFLFPGLLIPLIFFRKRLKVLAVWAIAFVLLSLGVAANVAWNNYNESITIDTSPNINTHEYLPFAEETKIAKLDHEASLKFGPDDDLPIVDGAAAFFPVYSAFVSATYPDTTELEYDGVFRYNNTVAGYQALAKNDIDIFFGVYPSEEQIAFAENLNTGFVYTPIATDAFVFFVHKDNPIDDLTSEQIRKIYSGEITNWKKLGGKNEEIAAFQRNEGSGSQSMLVRFMNGTKIMEPPTELRNGLMSGIIESVADYKSKSGSIGFSFRYYVESIIAHPDIKVLSIDGISPTYDNIKSGAYPITEPFYAVTYKNNDNENAQKLIDWVLSDEGNELIEKTGYVAK